MVSGDQLATDQRDKNPCEEVMPGMKIQIGRSRALIHLPERIISSQASFKVNLHNHLVVAFEPYLRDLFLVFTS